MVNAKILRLCIVCMTLGAGSFISSGEAIASSRESETSRPARAVKQVLIAQDRYPAWSPDGGRIVFDSNRSGTQQVFIMDADGGELVQLTRTRSESGAGTPVVSPDGRWIAFADSGPLFLMRTDGSDLRQFTSPVQPGDEGARLGDSHPKWAPDGRSIIFNRDVERGNAEIFEIGIDGRHLRRLTDYPHHDTYPSISPDGRFILWRRVLPEGGWFFSATGRNSEIFIAERDGSNPRNLTNHTAFDGYPTWLPGGEGIVFASNRDGQERLDFNIYVMRPDGSGVTRLTEILPGVLQARPSVSPDGRSIVFNRDFTHSENDRTVQIFVLELDNLIADLLENGSGTSDGETP